MPPPLSPSLSTALNANIFCDTLFNFRRKLLEKKRKYFRKKRNLLSTSKNNRSQNVVVPKNSTYVRGTYVPEIKATKKNNFDSSTYVRTHATNHFHVLTEPDHRKRKLQNYVDSPNSKAVELKKP